jgi:energy-coupling factor transport system ATP-binding protein
VELECIVIELKNVFYTYPGSDRFVLRGIDAKVECGEFIAVIGPNGSGKSTLARLMSGLLLPARGQVLIDGLDTGTPEAREEIRRRVGLVLQNPDNQLVAVQVEEDVAFGPGNLNLPPAEIRRRVDESLEAVNLSGLRARPPHLLSGGEKQRLAIAGILALRPRYLVLDEPTSMLDPLGRREVLRVLRNLAQSGISVILITHLMEEAALSDRVWVLADGGLAANDSPGAVFSRPGMLRELGLGLPFSAELACSVAAPGVDVPPGIVTMEDLVCFLCSVLKQTS